MPQENNIPCDLEPAPESSQKVEVPQTSRPSSSSSSSLSLRPSPSTSGGINIAEAEFAHKLPSSSSLVDQQSRKLFKGTETFESSSLESTSSFPSSQSEVKSADLNPVPDTKKGFTSGPGQQQQSERTDWTSPNFSSTSPILQRTTSRDVGESTIKGHTGQDSTLGPIGQDFVYLLPETSGFPDSDTGLPEIKRGRGRPKGASSIRKPR